MKLTQKINFLELFREHTFLGVDIGTSSIKIVQLTRKGSKYKLDTYGEIHLFSRGDAGEFEEASLRVLDDQVADLIIKIIKESGAEAKKTAMSVPVFSSFSTVIEMLDLSKNELKKAIEFQARQYIPVPMDQVSLSSTIIEREKKEEGSKVNKIQVLLVAIPNEVKSKYSNISMLSGVDLVALEMETFPMARSIAKGIKSPVLIIDVGSKSTNYCIVDNGFVRLSHNYDISGVAITKAFLKITQGDYKKAEELKKAMGLKMTPAQKEDAKDVFRTIDGVLAETERIMNVYFNKSNHRISEVFLSGGSANMLGLSEYFEEKLKIKASVADPFSGLIYPEELQKTLKNIGPSFSVAVGLAMRR